MNGLGCCRLRSLMIFAIAAVCLTGCTICQDCGDLDYPTYGGAWERTRRDGGRVGSVFDPAGERTAVLSDRDSDLGDAPAPDPKKDSSDPESNDADDTKADSEDKPDATDRSPSDRPDDSDPAEKPDQPESDAPSTLRGLELDEINIEKGNILPPDL